MKNKGLWSSLIIITLIACGCAFFLLRGSSVSKTHQGQTKYSVAGDNLSNTLVKNTTLGVDNFPQQDRVRFRTINGKLYKQHYIGAFIGVKQGKIMYSNSMGKANARLNNDFRSDTTVFAGQFQSLINNTMILKLVKEHKLSLKDKIGTSVSGIKKSDDMTIRQLLSDGSSLYIRKNELNTKGIVPNPDKVKLYTNKTNNSKYIKADEVIKLLLLCKTEGMNYSQVVNKLLVNQISLSNTRVVNAKDDTQANDAISYKYTSNEGVPTQTKNGLMAQSYNGIPVIRLSLSDLVVLVNEQFAKSTFSGEVKSVYLASLSQSMKHYIVKSSSYVFSSEYSGQYIGVVVSKSGKKQSVVISNYPNRLSTVYGVAAKLYTLL